jgi:GNAT superfamily N-acetyltransferase
MSRPPVPFGPSEAYAKQLADVRQIEGPLQCRSGETIYVRAIRPDDGPRLQAFHARLSTDSIVYRFFRYLPALPDADAQRFTHLDYVRRMALVAIDPRAENESLVAVVRYEQVGPGLAEVAFVVADLWQGQGIATALLRRLAAYARRRDIGAFLAITMASNSRMLDTLRHAGYPLAYNYDRDEVAVRLDITRPTEGEPTLPAEPDTA